MSVIFAIAPSRNSNSELPEIFSGMLATTRLSPQVSSQVRFPVGVSSCRHWTVPSHIFWRYPSPNASSKGKNDTKTATSNKALIRRIFILPPSAERLRNPCWIDQQPEKSGTLSSRVWFTHLLAVLFNEVSCSLPYSVFFEHECYRLR